MESHVKILAVLQIVCGALGLLAAAVVFLIFGGAASIVGTAGVAEDPDALIAVPIIGVVGTVIVALVLALSVPALAAGIGLLNFRPWARILTIIISVLNLPNIPIGTALGAYGLWVMLSAETERLFRSQTPQAPAQPGM